jgi:ADP-ribosylglycohydrolase
MRISPLALVPWITGTTGEELTVMASSLTHNDAASTGSSVAMVTICRELLTETGRPDDPWWWLERWIAVARSVEGATRYSPRGGAFRTWSGSLWQFLDTHVRDAFRAGLSTVEACNRWYSGAYLLETVPSVIYILMRHAHDPVEAIVRAVNDTRDNDTVAAIVGAAVGAAYGAEVLPARWVDNLTGRVNHDDDGTVQRLTEMAVARVCD